MSDPHMAGYCRQYRRTRCWADGCDELVPLVQDDRLRGVYCRDCQQFVGANARGGV